MNNKKKIMVLGVSRSGKDQLCEYLRDVYGYNYTPTSWLIAEKVAYPSMRDKFGYKSVQECFDDRHQHRPLWKSLLKAYNANDKARFVKEVLAVNDFYVGLRCEEELAECKRQGVFDKIFWINRDGTTESESSCTVKPHMAQYYVDNNADLDTLKNVGAAYVHHVLTDDSLTGFCTNNSKHYGQFLESEYWNIGDSRPLVAGQYKVIAHDIVSSWYEEAYYDGKYWLTNKGGQQYPCIIDKWMEV